MAPSPAGNPPAGDDLVAQVAWAAEAAAPGTVPDPDAAAARARAAGLGPADLAASLGLAWPMPPGLLQAAYWAARARHHLARRDQAIRDAARDGQSRRAIGAATGLSHTAIGRITTRPPGTPGTRW